MKSHHEDTPVSLQRRRLLWSLPGGLALASPLALISCGGGGSDDTGAPPASEGGLREPGRAYVGTLAYTETAVDIDVPAGVALPKGGLAVYSALGGFGVVSGTRATVRHLFGTPQWTTLLTAEGLPLLFGYVGAGMTTLSVHSTAVALLAFAIGAEFSGGTTNAAWIDELRNSTAATDCAAAIGAALAADSYAIAIGSAAITDAVLAAIRQLLPGVRAAAAGQRARALGVTVNPPNPSSGLQTIIGDALNTVYVQNEKLRRAHHVIKREGYTPSGGAEVADAARPRIAAGDVPMLPGFESAGSIIGSVTQAYYAGDSTGLAFSRTPETPIPVTPDDAKRTRYSVTVLTAGNAALSYDPDAYAKLSDDEKRMIDITLFAPENLALKQLFIDLLVPLFLTWIGGKIGDQGKGLGPREYKEKLELALLGQILSVFQSTLPNIVAKMRDPRTYPDYGVGGALREIVRSHLIDYVDVPVPGRTLSVPVLSKFSTSMVLLMMKFLAYEVMSDKAGEALLNALDSDANDLNETLFEWRLDNNNAGQLQAIKANKASVALAGLGMANKCLGLVNDALDLLSKTRLLADMATSRLLESWQATSIRAKVRLNPNPLEVDVSGIYAVSAEIVDNDDDAYGNEKGSFKFVWVCSALAGDLYKRGSSEINSFETSNANATADYVPRGAEPEAGVEDTIEVSAYFEPIGSSKPSELIGKFTLPVKFKKAFNLVLSPPGTTDVPTDITLPVTALIKETLPAGATVDWEWSHAGAGSIEAVPADSVANDSMVLFTSATEGSATVSVRARINLIAANGQPPRSVLADPVSTTLNVKKGVKTITLTPPCGVFACGPLCGVTDYTAYIVPRIPGALSYTAVFSGFGYGPCNRSVTWNSERGDGGGCSFPISYHPFSAREAARAWAVWIGFGGPPPTAPAKCVVTITLPA